MFLHTMPTAPGRQAMVAKNVFTDPPATPGRQNTGEKMFLHISPNMDADVKKFFITRFTHPAIHDTHLLKKWIKQNKVVDKDSIEERVNLYKSAWPSLNTYVYNTSSKDKTGQWDNFLCSFELYTRSGSKLNNCPVLSLPEVLLTLVLSEGHADL